MKRSNSLTVPKFGDEDAKSSQDLIFHWSCEGVEDRSSSRLAAVGRRKIILSPISPGWAEAVPEIIERLASSVAERKKQEIRVNLLEITVNGLSSRINKLEAVQAKVTAINTFAPEPYDLLKPILISLHSTEGGYIAGWHDVNAYASGDSEGEAVSGLKSFILDMFDNLSAEPADNLGKEAKRQLSILNQFIIKQP
jgi:hypothetical protein